MVLVQSCNDGNEVLWFLLPNTSRGNGSCLCSCSVHKENLSLPMNSALFLDPPRQSNLIFCLLLHFIAVDVSQGAVLRNILILLVSVTVPHLSGEPRTGPN